MGPETDALFRKAKASNERTRQLLEQAQKDRQSAKNNYFLVGVLLFGAFVYDMSRKKR